MEPITKNWTTGLTVTQLNGQIRELLENALPYVRVRGEIYDLKAPPSGHLYFTLGDGESQIRAVIWRTARLRMAHKPTNGEGVLVTGRVAVYTPRGEYQLVVEGLTPAGPGLERELLLRLHGKLAAEGLFEATRKRPLPLYPTAIGVVTSRAGAALHDIIRVLDERIGGYHLILAHARVQGEGAAEEIAAAMDLLNRDGRSQVIICGRGGGSSEDLVAFNSEVVVRAIARSAVPVISAVGHEVDTTLADLVADSRAATPSVAAQQACADRQNLTQRIAHIHHRLIRAMGQRHSLLQGRLEQVLVHLRHPRHRIDAYRRLCDELPERLARAIHYHLEKRQQRLTLLQQRLLLWSTGRQLATFVTRLERLNHRLYLAMTSTMAVRQQQVTALENTLHSLSPLQVLGRGYALVRDPAGHLVRQADTLQPGSPIHVSLASGSLDATVVKIHIGK